MTKEKKIAWTLRAINGILIVIFGGMMTTFFVYNHDNFYLVLGKIAYVIVIVTGVGLIIFVTTFFHVYYMISKAYNLEFARTLQSMKKQFILLLFNQSLFLICLLNQNIPDQNIKTLSSTCDIEDIGKKRLMQFMRLLVFIFDVPVIIYGLPSYQSRAHRMFCMG